MMQRLQLDEGEVVSVEYKKLPKANFAKFQPQSMSFIDDISDHRAVLERHLREFSCLSQGDVILIRYLAKDYEVKVLETKPENAVSIIDTDMNVDFATPIGYRESHSECSTRVNKANCLLLLKYSAISIHSTLYT
jgi:ubiquitin fusion degradation protein 1